MKRNAVSYLHLVVLAVVSVMVVSCTAGGKNVKITKKTRH